MGEFGSHLLFAFRRRVLILLFASPVVELRFIQTKFAGGSGYPKFKGFLAEFRVYGLRGFLVVDAGFIM
jgi:hypothetical protein